MSAQFVETSIQHGDTNTEQKNLANKASPLDSGGSENPFAAQATLPAEAVPFAQTEEERISQLGWLGTQPDRFKLGANAGPMSPTCAAVASNLNVPDNEEDFVLEEIKAVPKRERQGGEPPTDVHLVLMLDESGSMSSQTVQVIEGVNAMLEEQRKPRDGAAAGEGQVFFLARHLQQCLVCEN